MSTAETPNTPAPIAAVLAVTFLASVGTGAATNGVYFVADEMLGYTRVQNLWLAVYLGVLFVPAALLAGPVTRRLRRVFRASTRALLIAVLLGITASCLVPVFFRSTPGIVGFVTLFSPLTGLLWPIVESFLSGGRSGEQLRRATGRFNLSWAAATFGGYWMMQPLMNTDPALVFFGLGAVHLVAIGAVFRLPSEPAKHLATASDHPQEAAAREKTLLVCFRLLLFASYVMHAALTPMLPAILQRLEVPQERHLLVASVWMATRFGAFVLLERWHGWHGRFRTLVWSGACMALGVLGVAVAPNSGLLIAALAVLGLGIGAAYAAALYYAMEVGRAEVDAGGKHEGMIGLGYLVGPLATLLAIGAVEVQVLPAGAQDSSAIAGVGGIALVVGVRIILLACRRPRG